MSAAALLVLAAAFAFPNEQGTRLLATGEIAKPEALRVLTLHAAEDAGQFTELVSDSWYRSPI